MHGEYIMLALIKRGNARDLVEVMTPLGPYFNRLRQFVELAIIILLYWIML